MNNMTFTDEKKNADFQGADVESAAAADTVHTVDDMDIDPYAAVEGKEGDHIEYRTMGWLQAGALITAETIALGILSFPSVFHRLGMFGGVFTTVALAVLSWQTGYVLVQFKMNHPGVMNFADAGRVIAGKWGGWILGGGLILKTTLIAGSHELSGAIALKSISSNVICSIAWAAIIGVLGFILSVPRTFEKVSYISFLSVGAILTSCFITLVAAGVQDPSVLVSPGEEPIRWHAFENHGLDGTIGAFTNIIFAYGGHVAIFSFCSEMRNPKDFKKSLALVQTLSTIAYVIVGAVGYRYMGQYAPSPALSGTSKPVHITAYAIALISIIISGVVPAYVGGKWLYMTMFRGTKTLTSRGLRAWLYWAGIMATIWIIGFIIAELIPFFSQLLSIISSILTVWFTYGLSGVLWLYDNNPKAKKPWTMGGYFSSVKKAFLTLLSIFVIIMSTVIMVLGIYSAVKGIIDGYAQGDYSHPFACAT